jgi:hypothetical protein
MGFFSWRTQDTDRSIANKYSNRETFIVFMIDDKGNYWMEDNYDGYGEFGGKDFYELLAEMNGLDSDRGEGIDLAFSGKPYKSPNLVERKVDWVYTEEEPESCDDQGYFYGGYEEDEEDDY